VPRWWSVPDLLKAQEEHELVEWNLGGVREGDEVLTRAAVAKLMEQAPNAHEMAGGLTGVDPDMYRIRAALTALGRQSLVGQDTIRKGERR
jgi:hypothetical protein